MNSIEFDKLMNNKVKLIGLPIKTISNEIYIITEIKDNQIKAIRYEYNSYNNKAFKYEIFVNEGSCWRFQLLEINNS